MIMRSALIIAGRELRACLASPLPYLVGAGMLVFLGYRFAAGLFSAMEASLRSFFTHAGAILVFVAPLLTMRLLAEEQRSGTIELLLTSPVREREVVAGKFLAGLGMLMLLLTPTLYYVLALAIFGNPDFGPLVSGYMGMVLLGSALVSIGILTSALTSRPIVSAALGITILACLWWLPIVAGLVSESLRMTLAPFSLAAHLEDFTKGIVDSKDVIFYLSVIAGALFFATRALEGRRGR